MPTDTTQNPHRIERAIGTAAASVIGFGVIAMLVILVLGLTKLRVSGGVWPVVAILPEIAFPIGIALILAYIVVSAIRRTREARDAEH